MQGEQYQYQAEGSQPAYQAEGSQPVATGTVVEQPVVLSGTIVNVEQPAPTAYAVQQPGKMPVVRAPRRRPWS